MVETFPTVDTVIKFWGAREPTQDYQSTDYSLTKRSRAAGALGNPEDVAHVENAAANLEEDIIAVHVCAGLTPLLPDGSLGLRSRCPTLHFLARFQ